MQEIYRHALRAISCAIILYCSGVILQIAFEDPMMTSKTFWALTWPYELGLLLGAAGVAWSQG